MPTNIPSVEEFTKQLVGWETLTKLQKEFICMRRFIGTDVDTVEHLAIRNGESISVKRIQGWRRNNPYFRQIELSIINGPLEVANALIDDLVPVALMQLYFGMTGKDGRVADNAARTVLKMKGLLGEERGGERRGVIILMPFERGKLADGNIRPVKALPTPRGTTEGTCIVEED
uniref:Uncharacterized protein n=1 Tax=viral metagenome TaxID=1070528 RepID=A0A6M3KE98_9ZZZZ